MYAQKRRSEKSKNRVIGNYIAQNKNSMKQGFQLVDNRPQAIAQRKLQEIANNSPQVKQVVVNSVTQKKDRVRQNFGFVDNQHEAMAQMKLLEIKNKNTRVKSKGKWTEMAVNDDVGLETEATSRGPKAFHMKALNQQDSNVSDSDVQIAGNGTNGVGFVNEQQGDAAQPEFRAKENCSQDIAIQRAVGFEFQTQTGIRNVDEDRAQHDWGPNVVLKGEPGLWHMSPDMVDTHNYTGVLEFITNPIETENRNVVACIGDILRLFGSLRIYAEEVQPWRNLPDTSADYGEIRVETPEEMTADPQVTGGLHPDKLIILLREMGNDENLLTDVEGRGRIRRIVDRTEAQMAAGNIQGGSAYRGTVALLASYVTEIHYRCAEFMDIFADPDEAEVDFDQLWIEFVPAYKKEAATLLPRIRLSKLDQINRLTLTDDLIQAIGIEHIQADSLLWPMGVWNDNDHPGETIEDWIERITNEVPNAGGGFGDLEDAEFWGGTEYDMDQQQPPLIDDDRRTLYELRGLTNNILPYEWGPFAVQYMLYFHELQSRAPE